MEGSPYYVIVCDLFNLHEPDHETVVLGFPTREQAIEYARRRTWTSVEQVREPGLSREELKRRWLALGEDCRVVGPEGVIYLARSELDTFLETPPPPERRDWHGLYRSLLPDDFTLTYTWAEGSVPPPHYYEYTITVVPPDQGHIAFLPDYTANAPPTWERAFHPDLTSRILVFNWLRATGRLGQSWPTSVDAALGGETGYLDVSTGGRRTHLAVHLLPEAERRALHNALCAIVPAIIWQELEARHRQYIGSRYPNTGE